MVISIIKILLISLWTFVCSIIAILFIVFDRSFNLYFKISPVFSGGILKISQVKIEKSGLDNFDHSKPYIFVSNHSSQYDIPVLQNTIPGRMGMIFKKELAKIPFFGWQLKWGPYVMIDRKDFESALKSIEKAKERISRFGMSVIVFAEGTRSKTGEVQPFKRGAFYLASRSGYPIIPVSISHSNKIMPKGKFRIQGGKVKVYFDKPIPTNQLINKKDELELMEKVRSIIIQNIEKD
ncbi:MAG: 1-acyl-sn-glycerol-3-phosphate acyltransferase [Ignavibacteriales bacterium]|nr:1-acyl-sn-glycerol-3-phosphate acyltransferase [Ignavibacteriales bacterium]